MKNIILILLVCTAPIFSQQPYKTVTVTGETAQKKASIEKYVVTVEIREVLADGYSNMEAKNVQQQVVEYKNKLNGVNIDFNKFEENVIFNATNTCCGNSYNYSTNSIDEIRTILATKMKGVTSWATVKAKEQADNYIATINKEAINDAQNKAKLIAKNINKKIGDILTIKDTNLKQYYVNNSKPDYTQKYYVEVTFILEDL